MHKGTLFLIPSPLGDEALQPIPEYTLQALRELDYFIAERAKTARHFIKSCQHPKPLAEITVEELDKHAPDQPLQPLLQPLLEGRSGGLLSEAGCPGVADPGARVVALAHALGIPVRPLVGPSSILLALMASGLNGQQFCFHGYLPANKGDLAQQLKKLEQLSAQRKETQIFIETPYRNQALLETALRTLQPTTRLCIACNLTLPGEYILTRSMADWKKLPPPDLDKKPAVFLLDNL